MVEEKFSCIKELTKTVRIALPSSYISNEIAGVTDILESWKRQYNQQLQGIVVSYKNISLTWKSGCIVIDKPYVHYDIKATFELFCPSTGSIVQGKVNRVSHDYIGCLIHNTINATIKRFSSSLDGFSEFIALDRMILFKITCFGYHQKVIKVKGEITEECVNLMKELAPFNTQSSIFQDGSSSYFSTAELTEDTVKDNEENSEEYSESLIAPNYSSQCIFNVDHLADRSSNDVPSTPHESDSSEELKTDLENKSEKHNLHKMFATHPKEMDIDDPISGSKSLLKKKKHKDKKSKDKSFNVTEPPKISINPERHKKSPSKKKKSKKDKTLNDSSFDATSGIETFDDLKISLSPKMKKTNKSQLNTGKLNEFSSTQQNAVNPFGILPSNNFNIDFSIKEEVPMDSDYRSPSPKKKSKKSKNKSLGIVNNNVNSSNIDEMMNVFAAFEPSLEEQLHSNEISSSAIKKEPIAATKNEKKRKRESSDKDGLPSKKKKSEGDKSASKKSKSKLKKGKSKKRDKEKSKKDKKKKKPKDKKSKSKKAQLSYKIKKKKKKDKLSSKKLKTSSKDKTKDVAQVINKNAK